jgi:hypothetical protein
MEQPAMSSEVMYDPMSLRVIAMRRPSSSLCSSL